MTQSALAGERILIAEDDEGYRAYLSALLTREGCVVMAGGGGDAVAAVRSFHPTLLITDLALSDRDALELCRDVRAVDGADGLPILLLSGRQAAGAVGELALPLVWYLEKGAASTTLKRELEVLLAASRRGRASAS